MASLQIRDISPEIYQLLSLLAQRENINMSQVVNTLVKEALLKRLKTIQDKKASEVSTAAETVPKAQFNFEEIESFMNIQ